MSELDELSQTIGSLCKGQRDLEGRMKGVEGELKVVSATLSEAKGGWRVMMLFAGVSGVLGGLATKALGTMLK